MKRHRLDPLSAALGVVVILLAVAVMARGADVLVAGGSWWFAVGALVIGLGLVPWRGLDRGAPDSKPPDQNEVVSA